MSNIFKVSNEDTRTMLLLLTLNNFEINSLFTLWFILLNLNKCLLGLRHGLFKYFFQQLWEIYCPIGLWWTGTIYWIVCFHPYSPNIKLRKDKFSRQYFKQVSQTLLMSSNIEATRVTFSRRWNSKSIFRNLSNE